MADIIVEGLTWAQNILFYSAPPALPPTIIADTTSSLVHVYTDGITLLDTANNVWSMSGTVPFNVASGAFPPSFGGFSNVNYFVSGAARLNVANVRGVAIVKNTNAVTPGQWIMSAGVFQTSGWYLGNSATPRGQCVANAPGNSQIADLGGVGANDIVSVFCFGTTTSGSLIQFNNGTIFTSPSLAYVPNSTAPVYIGNYNGTTQAWPKAIAEIYIEAGVPNSASFSSFYTQAKARLGSLLP